MGRGIDKLGIFLYLAISLFAIANIYSVDEGLGTKQFIFFGISLVVRLVIFHYENKVFRKLCRNFFHIGHPFISRFTCFWNWNFRSKKLVQFGGFTMQPM